MTPAEVIAVLRTLPQDREVWVVLPGMLDAQGEVFAAMAPVEFIGLDDEGDVIITGEKG